jgi:prevent-host-death family protein
MEKSMTQVDVDEAKTHFSRLLDAVAAGQSVTIARAGVPVARLVPYTEEKRVQRLGFLAGRVTIPDGFDDLAVGRIEALFEGP